MTRKVFAAVAASACDTALVNALLQRVILDFENIHWPHMSVATLVKAG